MSANAPIAPSELIINTDGSVYHLALRPDQLADKIITVGDPDRVEAVAQYLTDREFTLRKREFVSTTGQYQGKRITVLSTGMGTDNVEIVINELDALVNIDVDTRLIKERKKALDIVRIGTSGALQTEIPLDAALCSVQAIGLDTLMAFYPLNQSPADALITAGLQQSLGIGFRPYLVKAAQSLVDRIGHDMIPGTTLTCPGFYAPQGRMLRLQTKVEDAVLKYQQFRWDGGGVAWQDRLTNFEMETAGYYALGTLLGHHVLSVNAIVAHRISNTFSTRADDVIDQLVRKVLDRI